MLKIGVLGSCVSRDIFNRQFIPNYKDFFKCTSYQHHISFISLMSEPIPYDWKKLKDNSMSKITEIQLLTELEKSPLIDLVSTQPDYIIIDFYADILYGAVKVNGSYLTGKMFKFTETKLAEDLVTEETYFPRKDFDSFFEVWKPKFDDFIKFQQEQLPNSKVIVNKARCSNLTLDISSMDLYKTHLKYDTDKLNEMWGKLDEYAISVYGLTSIHYDKSYYLDKNYIFGEGIVHFHKNFYQDYFNKLLKISFDDLITKSRPVENKLRQFNLIQNADFNDGFHFWSELNGDISINEDFESRYIYVQNKNINKDKKTQIWSNSIQVDIKSEYILSFDIKVKNLQEVDSRKCIFCIRSFKDRRKYKFSDSLESIDLSLNDFELYDNIWGKCEFRFKPNGEFIKIAPFLFRNGEVSWRNIQLTRVNG